MIEPDLDGQAIMRHPLHHVVLTREGQEAMCVQGAMLELPTDRWAAHEHARQNAAGGHAPADREALARTLLELCAQGAVLFSIGFLF
jgi:hypothetical protein